MIILGYDSNRSSELKFFVHEIEVEVFNQKFSGDHKYKVCSKSSQTFSEKRQQTIIFAKFIYWLQNSPLPSQYRV